jgi:hypothetical protein
MQVIGFCLIFILESVSIPYCKSINLLGKIYKFRWNVRDIQKNKVSEKKLRRAEGGAKDFGVFRVKNHDFTPKNHIYSNCGGRRENFWGISCEKSRFYAKKNHIFSNFRGGGTPPLDPPLMCQSPWLWLYLRDINC